MNLGLQVLPSIGSKNSNTINSHLVAPFNFVPLLSFQLHSLFRFVSIESGLLKKRKQKEKSWEKIHAPAAPFPSVFLANKWPSERVKLVSRHNDLVPNWKTNDNEKLRYRLALLVQSSTLIKVTSILKHFFLLLFETSRNTIIRTSIYYIKRLKRCETYIFYILIREDFVRLHF